MEGAVLMACRGLFFGLLLVLIIYGPLAWGVWWLARFTPWHVTYLQVLVMLLLPGAIAGGVISYIGLWKAKKP